MPLQSQSAENKLVSQGFPKRFYPSVRLNKAEIFYALKGEYNLFFNNGTYFSCNGYTILEIL
jgi:hypothetical protein